MHAQLGGRGGGGGVFLPPPPISIIFTYDHLQHDCSYPVHLEYSIECFQSL